MAPGMNQENFHEVLIGSGIGKSIKEYAQACCDVVSINLNLGLNEFIYKTENDAINLLKKFDDNYSDLQLFKERLFKQKNSCKLFDPKTFVIELSDKLYNLINNQR